MITKSFSWGCLPTLVPEDKFFNTSRNIVNNVLDGAIEIIKSGNDVKKACDMETCSSSSSEEEQDHAVQTANDPVPEVIYKTQDLINTESRIEEADKVGADFSPAHSSSDRNLANDIVYDAIDNAKERWQKMLPETDCARTNTKSKPISQPCLSNVAISEQQKEAEKTEKRIKPPKLSRSS